MEKKGFYVKAGDRVIHVLVDDNMSEVEFEQTMKTVESITNGEITRHKPTEESQTSLDFPKDYGFECSMCGKPMEYRYCGMCTDCEMVWNG